MQRMDKNGALTKAHHFFYPYICKQDICKQAGFAERKMRHRFLFSPEYVILKKERSAVLEQLDERFLGNEESVKCPSYFGG